MKREKKKKGEQKQRYACNNNIPVYLLLVIDCPMIKNI